MPFASKAQARFMFSKKPEMAKEFASKTPDMKALPEKKNAMHHLQAYRYRKKVKKHAFV